MTDEVLATARRLAAERGHPLDPLSDDDLTRGLLRLRAAVAKGRSAPR
jgi:hypothetical protein